MSFRTRHRIPDLGVGVGFRPKHAREVLEGGGHAAVDWFEVISENFMVPGGRPIANLEKLRALAPVIPHGVSMSIGAVTPLEKDYLARLGVVLDRLNPAWFSDHLCFCKVGDRDVHDLLPIPFTKEALMHVAERIKRVQGEMERPLALENASSYLTFASSEMGEAEFLAELCERADCGILLDVNNVYVSAQNHGFDAEAYIDAIPEGRVVQIHLAGHMDKGRYLLDTHSDHVASPVWDLYARAIRRIGAVSTLIEWDDLIPEWDVLVAEANLARARREEALR